MNELFPRIQQAAAGVYPQVAVTALEPSGLLSAEIVRARRKLDFDLTARDLALRALPNVLLLDPEGNTRALDLLRQARERATPESGLSAAEVRKDPAFAPLADDPAFAAISPISPTRG